MASVPTRDIELDLGDGQPALQLTLAAPLLSEIEAWRMRMKDRDVFEGYVDLLTHIAYLRGSFDAKTLTGVHAFQGPDGMAALRILFSFKRDVRKRLIADVDAVVGEVIDLKRDTNEKNLTTRGSQSSESNAGSQSDSPGSPDPSIRDSSRISTTRSAGRSSSS